MTDQNAQAKQRFMKSFFEAYRKRCDVLPQLRANGYPNEAMLVCCCYIEGLGNWFYGDERYHRNFVRVLREHGGEDVLWHIHVKPLGESLADTKRGKAVRALAEKIQPLLAGYQGHLLTEAEVEAAVAGALSSEELERLRKNLWRGTVASVAYAELRSEAVHSLGTPGGIRFGEATFRGAPVPRIDFELLYRALERILGAALEVSLTTGKWFGRE